MFHGPNSGFPLSPWLGFVCFGGFLGSLIARWENKIQSLWFLFSAVALSILLVFMEEVSPIFRYIDAN